MSSVTIAHAGRAVAGGGQPGGLPEVHVREQLKAYRSGKRSLEVMNVIALEAKEKP